jgi:uncharacterized membrane protein
MSAGLSGFIVACILLAIVTLSGCAPPRPSGSTGTPNAEPSPWADAARRGAIFRALGNEPAWTLEIRRDSILVLTTDLGATRTMAQYSAPVIDGPRTTYHATAAQGQMLTVLIEQRACADIMSGEPFEAAVIVTFDARTLRGCGRSL